MKNGEGGSEMTLSEAARLKGVSRAAIHKAIQDGRLPARVQDVGAARRVWMIRHEDVQAYEPLPREVSLRKAREHRHPKTDGEGEA